MARETIRLKDMTLAERKAILPKRKNLTAQEERNLKKILKKRERK